MRKFKFTINGNQYSADILSVEDNIAQIDVNGIVYSVEVDNTLKATKTPTLVRSISVPSTDIHPSQAKTSNPSAHKGGGSIKSPLPGVIIEMHVKVGDVVKMGQKLLVLEAMKMENNIEADKEGRIVSVNKQKGDSVMEGDELILIE